MSFTVRLDFAKALNLKQNVNTMVAATVADVTWRHDCRHMKRVIVLTRTSNKHLGCDRSVDNGWIGIDSHLRWPKLQSNPDKLL